MARSSPRPHPPLGLAQAGEVARAITEHNAGRPMNRILLASAMGVSPNSSAFREHIMSSYRYGLSEGNYSSESISLTALGEAISRPRNDYERILAEREALRHVPIFAQLLQHFMNNRLPDAQFLKNTIERAPFGMDPAWSNEIADLFAKNAKDVGFLREINGANYLVDDGGTAVPEGSVTGQDVVPDHLVPATNAEKSANEKVSAEDSSDKAHVFSETRPTAPVQVFVAHGRNPKPLEQLKKILNEWQVPFLVAMDEPNAGRPISEKVADLMKACNAGIFIFTGDEELKNERGETVFRPSQNVIYELGAASLIYGRKIVIFKESTVSFPSDFSDLGFIDFNHDALDAKAMDLLRELIALKAVRLVSSISS